MMIILAKIPANRLKVVLGDWLLTINHALLTENVSWTVQLSHMK